MPIVLNGTTGITTPALENDGVTLVAPGSAAAPAITTDGDTNTGIFFPGADRIGFAEGGVQVGEFDASGNFQFNSGYGSVATAFGCRAWVNFDGATSPGTIRASGNVSSVTRNGTGDYTVNFTTAMPDASYSKIVTSSPEYGNAVTTAITDVASSGLPEVAPTASNFRLLISQTTTATRINAKYISVSVFR
jgi:hypothetical protein